MIDKLLSGGQTGVDRAALDVGLALGLPVGGWCPKGRRAEDGRTVDHLTDAMRSNGGSVGLVTNRHLALPPNGWPSSISGAR